jgi:hypothetical protein
MSPTHRHGRTASTPIHADGVNQGIVTAVGCLDFAPPEGAEYVPYRAGSVIPGIRIDLVRPGGQAGSMGGLGASCQSDEGFLLTVKEGPLLLAHLFADFFGILVAFSGWGCLYHRSASVVLDRPFRVVVSRTEEQRCRS